MSKFTTITADGFYPLIKTGGADSVVIIVAAAAALGGGTVTLSAHADSADPATVELLTDGAAIAGFQKQVTVGRDMVFGVTVAGSTAASIGITVALAD